MTSSSSSFFILFFFIVVSRFFIFTTTSSIPAGRNTIVFATLGRSHYAFDIFSVPITISSSSSSSSVNVVLDEIRLTDGVSVNYNGFFPSNSTYLLSVLTRDSPFLSSSSSLIYVSERDGSADIIVNFIPSSSSFTRRRSALRLSSRLRFPIHLPPAMKDRPTLTGGDRLIYVSTHEPSRVPRQSWAAVYSTVIFSGKTRRLTPRGVADFSPAVSPSGLWTAVASSGERGWDGEVEELNTDIFIFATEDGSSRTKLVGHGGWPCWANDHTLYFHRRSSDGWWSIYRTVIDFKDHIPSTSSVERITPSGFHAFTPAASQGAPGLLAVATRRPGSDFRHVELIDFSTGSTNYIEITRHLAPNSHHFNPFISPDGIQIGYHRCRGRKDHGDSPLLLESIKSSNPKSFSLFRIDGTFPSFSPSGDRIAYIGSSGLNVVNSDGSGGPTEVLPGAAFFTAWDRKREGVIYTSGGPPFASVTSEVDVLAITLNDKNSEISVKKLTEDGKNNAFPSPSPDGKWIVFRSGRSGHKNLYIMDAEEGEKAGLHRLTQGPWTDTMCNWSPDGELIAFASDRSNPGGRSYAIYLIHPNGTGLRKVVQSGQGGTTNHPWFSPDSKKLVFTTEFAGVSSEPIANPHHYQPGGEIFTINIDGSGLRRITHNSYEDGTPTWAPISLDPDDVAEDHLANETRCGFDDCHWLGSQNSILPHSSC